MRQRAVGLFEAAVKAADPKHSLRPHLQNLPEIDGRYLVVSVGKAACAMAEEAIASLPANAVFEAIAVTNYENARTVKGCVTLAAGHPLPDKNGEKAGLAVIDLLSDAKKSDVVIALISGGGSALLPAPVEGVSLTDKAEVSRVLLGAGFDITAMNLIRQQLSRLKGGGMARLAASARMQAFILSDVIGDDLRAIASGPTVAPISDRQGAVELLQRRGVFDEMPASVKEHLMSNAAEETMLPKYKNTLIGSNRQSLDAVLTASIDGVIVSDNLVGDVADAAKFVVNAAMDRPEKTLIFGGETTVKLQGNGKGGRNQELALRFAMLAECEDLGDWVFLSGGTDGRDGPTDAAGGIVDAGTLGRICAKGADPLKLLDNNDSYMALSLANDLLTIGATGTNVADVQILLRR